MTTTAQEQEYSDISVILFPPRETQVIDAACAGYLSQSDLSFTELYEKTGYRQAKEFLKQLIEMGHTSVIEHLVFRFAIESSRVVADQVIRHRISSQTHSSMRKFHKYQPEDFVIPSRIREEDREEWIQDCMRATEIFEKWRTDKDYSTDVARRHLPMGLRSKYRLTINARSLRNFFRLRLAEDADFEHRELARAMLGQVASSDFDFLFEDIPIVRQTLNSIEQEFLEAMW